MYICIYIHNILYIDIYIKLWHFRRRLIFTQPQRDFVNSQEMGDFCPF